jgi:pyridoxamine 5'-phosphate oxidase
VTESRGLDERDVDPDPLVAVRGWVEDARRDGVKDWDAMVVATADASAAPSARVVLLRGVDDRGFCFYSNYESRKGRELAENPRAALVLHWREQGRQVRAAGVVSRMTAAEAMGYWDRRPRPSRLSAWASRQSQPVDGRAALEAAVLAVRERFGDDGDIALPPFWGGYRVVPDELELWQHRDDRLHDRLEYRRAPDGSWAVTRLQP